MLFYPQSIREAGGKLVLPENTNAVAHPCLGAAGIGEFWQNFALGVSSLAVSPCEEYVFTVGNAERLSLEGYEYSINVKESGICICAENEAGLLHGFMTLLDRFEAVDLGEDTAIEIAC